MNAFWLKPLVAFGVFLAVSAQARAQPLFDFAESIECTVANADLVFVAKLVELGDVEDADKDEGAEATIAVEETLKVTFGERYERLRVRLRYPASALAEWKDHACRLLVAVKEQAPTATTVIDLAHEDLEVLTADFTLLRDPEDVVRIAKETVRRMPAAVKRIHTFRLWVPREVVAEMKSTKHSGTYLSVPVDERLEIRAHDYLRSESYPRRFEGAQALRYFKSDGNIARLKAALNDPGWAYLSHAEHNQGIEVRIYGVRQEAYRILKYWGLEMEKPVVREEVLKRDRAK